jgi:hypothetical protein
MQFTIKPTGGDVGQSMTMRPNQVMTQYDPHSGAPLAASVNTVDQAQVRAQQSAVDPALIALMDSLKPYVLLRRQKGSNFSDMAIELSDKFGLPERLAIEFCADLFRVEPQALQVPEVKWTFDVRSYNKETYPLGAEKHFNSKTRSIFASNKPGIVLFEKMLTESECDEIIGRAKPHLQKSQVVSAEDGGNIDHPNRVSSGMFFTHAQHPILAEIEKKIEKFFHYPSNYCEPFQVLNYQVGGKYEPHTDWMNPADGGYKKFAERGGQRIATLIFYLNTPKRGGGTSFPEAGLQFAAKKGNAIFFMYPDTHESFTLHGGDPVLEGEKWIATKWFRETQFL